MTDAELQERLAYWQKRLKLSDWHITAEFGGGKVLQDKARGECISVWCSKSAHIYVRPESAYLDSYFPTNAVMGEEEALVHELLHVHFAGFAAENDTPEDDLQHQVIFALAVALVEENRRTMAGNES